jgi:CheY-like chemotaxis protein
MHHPHRARDLCHTVVPVTFAPMDSQRVLLVDDEPAIRLAMRKWFERNGWSVDEADDGHAALTCLQTVHDGYGLVICDLHLPDTTGLEIAVQVESSWPQLLSRFVFSTGDNMEFEAPHRHLRDRTRVLLKPFDFSELRTLVHDIAGARPA